MGTVEPAPLQDEKFWREMEESLARTDSGGGDGDGEDSGGQDDPGSPKQHNEFIIGGMVAGGGLGGGLVYIVNKESARLTNAYDSIVQPSHKPAVEQGTFGNYNTDGAIDGGLMLSLTLAGAAVGALLELRKRRQNADDL